MAGQHAPGQEHQLEQGAAGAQGDGDLASLIIITHHHHHHHLVQEQLRQEHEGKDEPVPQHRHSTTLGACNYIKNQKIFANEKYL